MHRVESVLTESITTANEYNAIRTFEQQIHSIAPSLLNDIGMIFVKHGMNLEYGAALLHRHEHLRPEHVMIHTSPVPDMDLCKMERLVPTDASLARVPCAWHLNSQDQFQPYECRENISNIAPSKEFLVELRLFLHDHGLVDIIALSRISRIGTNLLSLWMERVLADGEGTVAGRCHEDDRDSIEGSIATEWAFTDSDGIKVTRACKEPREGGGHVKSK